MATEPRAEVQLQPSWTPGAIGNVPLLSRDQLVESEKDERHGGEPLKRSGCHGSVSLADPDPCPLPALAISHPPTARDLTPVRTQDPGLAEPECRLSPATVPGSGWTGDWAGPTAVSSGTCYELLGLAFLSRKDCETWRK